jgi:HEAT repeat protein
MEVPDAEMVPVLDEEGLTLYARTEPSRPDMFRAGDADLLIQLVVVEERPVVLLALTELTPGRPAVRRAALDPRGATERNVLEALRSSFHARVRLFAPDGRLVRAFEVRASRRVNTALVIERAQRLSGGDIDAVTAMERAFAAPPPVRDASHPFQTEEPPPARNAREALASLELLAEWSQPERLERALLALSVPKDVVDGSMRQILADAVRFGLALPPSLATRAVSVGVGADAAEIVARQLDAFRLTVERGDRGGLSVEQVAQNWEALIEAAGRHELSLDEKSHALARDAMRAVHGDRPSLPDNIDLAKLPTLDIPGLVMLLDHPKVRRDAALELAKRSEPQLLETLMKAVRKMPREEVVRVVPRLVDHGEAAGDAFIDALAARKTFVRQAAALGLGELKLRRAVVPVLHLLLSEQSEIWPELARTLGGFGTGAVRALTRALKDPKGQEARLSLALAHLALHGCEKQVEDLANGRDKKIAVIALEGLNLRPDARNSLGKVRGDRPLEPSDGVLQFSKRFMEEREGRAPEGDLTHD